MYLNLYILAIKPRRCQPWGVYGGGSILTDLFQLPQIPPILRNSFFKNGGDGRTRTGKEETKGMGCNGCLVARGKTDAHILFP